MVQRSRVHLTDAVQHCGETKVLGDAAFEVAEAPRVTVEQIQHVLAGAHRPLDAAQWVAVDEFPDALERDQRFLGRRGKPLAQCGGLRGDVVAAACHHQIPVACGPLGQPRCDRDAAAVGEFQGAPDL